MTPQLLGAVKSHRQHFRGRKWYILQDPANNQFFRVSEAAYHFVAMLDGRRTVNLAWRVCMDQFGDAAPTQGEVINLLSQLYGANLLQGNLTPDAQELFHRYQKRVRRELKSVLTNLLFIRIPLWDPDRFLNLWVGLVGKLFTWYGFLFWCALIACGIWTVIGNVGRLSSQTASILSPQNLPLLYLTLVFVKVLHEMGHAFSCKYFGKKAGAGGEVHQLGVTFLVFTPLPFVDASSAWALRNKWQRVVVGAGGMLVELAIASVAAILWTHTAEGTTVHAIAYNIMFIASVSTIMFNGNPFLRYDAYYILLDFLEIPNLDSRSRSYLYFLVKRYIWGVKRINDPSHTKGERGWLVFYAVTSTVCRVVIFAAIILFVGSKLFMIGAVLAAVIFGIWVLRPLGKFVRYLATSPELGRVRSRAIVISLILIGILAGSIGTVKMPDRCRIEGVVEPYDFAVIHMERSGFVDHFLNSGMKTGPVGAVLIQATSPQLEAKRDQLEAELRGLQIQRQLAQTREAAEAQIVEEKIDAMKEQIQRNRQDLDALALRSPISGTWVAPDVDRIKGTYVQRGQRVGFVADLDTLRIRAVAGQSVAGRLITEAEPVVEMRIKGRPDIKLAGHIERIIPAGYEELPSAALGYAAGGATQVDLKDPSGKRTAEPFFEILVIPDSPESRMMRPGQTMVLRFDTPAKPLLQQGWRSLLQLFQKRFQV